MRRNHLVVDNTEITGITPENTILELLNSLTDDAGVFTFLKLHVDQNTFLFAGHDAIRHEHLAPGLMIQKTRPVLTLVQREPNNQVSFRVIAFGYDVYDVDGIAPDEPEAHLVKTDQSTPAIIFDTLYFIVPAEENGIKGARLVVKEHTESSYHKDIDLYLTKLKPSLWEKISNFNKNNPLLFTSSIMAANGLTFSTLLALRLTFPESFVGSIATALTDVSSIPNFLGSLITFAASSVVGGGLSTGIGAILAQRATRKSIEYYHHFIGNSRDYTPNEHIKPTLITEPLILEPFVPSNSENTNSELLEIPDDTSMSKKILLTSLSNYYQELAQKLKMNDDVSIEIPEYNAEYIELEESTDFTELFGVSNNNNQAKKSEISLTKELSSISLETTQFQI